MELLNSLWNVVLAVVALLGAFVQFIWPWTPLLCWIAFWLLAVNWKTLYPALTRGGLIGVVLTMLMAILVWSVIDIPAGGSHQLFGLQVSNVVGKMVYVVALTIIAFMCGSVQLAGSVDRCLLFEEPAPEPDDHHGH